MIRHFIKYLLVTICMGLIFFMAYAGFIYIFLNGKPPMFTSLWSGLSFIGGIYVGVKLEDC